MVNLKNYVTVDLSAYPLLTEKEKNQLLVDFNHTESVFSENKTIIDLFEEQVKKTPYNVAVVFQEKELTYSDLNKKANQFANYIYSHYKINRGDVIGVFLPKA